MTQWYNTTKWPGCGHDGRRKTDLKLTKPVRSGGMTWSRAAMLLPTISNSTKQNDTLADTCDSFDFRNRRLYNTICCARLTTEFSPGNSSLTLHFAIAIGTSCVLTHLAFEFAIAQDRPEVLSGARRHRKFTW